MKAAELLGKVEGMENVVVTKVEEYSIQDLTTDQHISLTLILDREGEDYSEEFWPKEGTWEVVVKLDYVTVLQDRMNKIEYDESKWAGHQPRQGNQQGGSNNESSRDEEDQKKSDCSAGDLGCS